MSRKSIRPSTLDGIKRLATSLKAEQKIQHACALDLAAHAAGFQNFAHARRALQHAHGAGHPQPLEALLLSAYWENQESHTSGRESLVILLSTPWADLITPALFKNLHALAHFRAEGPDHLVLGFPAKSQSDARRAVSAAVRAFRFMDATKLRPSRSFSRVYPGGDARNAIPGREHVSIWYDRTTKRYLFADEPYENSIQDRLHEREAWAKQHGYAIAKPVWPGMYAPDIGTRLYLIAHPTKGIPLEPIVAALNKLRRPEGEDQWNGDSEPMQPRYLSPGSLAKLILAKAKRESAKPEVLSVPVKAPAEIRMGWSVVGRRNAANKPIQAGLWQPDTPKNRKELALLADAGNEAYGPGTHWIEERAA